MAKLLCMRPGSGKESKGGLPRLRTVGPTVAGGDSLAENCKKGLTDVLSEAARGSAYFSPNLQHATGTSV